MMSVAVIRPRRPTSRRELAAAAFAILADFSSLLPARRSAR
jgi:hypothetical protein